LIVLLGTAHRSPKLLSRSDVAGAVRWRVNAPSLVFEVHGITGSVSH
jgi:hypothetical protein